MPKETVEEFLKRGGKVQRLGKRGNKIYPNETREQRRQRLHEESVGLGDRPRHGRVHPVERLRRKYVARKQNTLQQIFRQQAKKTRKGLLGLGLTLTSLGSSIKEASKE